MSENLVEQSGIRYYENLPDGYRLASLDDFHIKGKKKLGMEFLIKGFHSGHFFCRTVDENLTASKILPWIKAGNVFIQKPQS